MTNSERELEFTFANKTSTRKAHTSDNVPTSMDEGGFQNLSGLFCFKVRSLIMKFSRRSVQFFQRYEPHCGKMTLLPCDVEDPSEILDQDTDADELQLSGIFLV